MSNSELEELAEELRHELGKLKKLDTTSIAKALIFWLLLFCFGALFGVFVCGFKEVLS